MLKALIVLAADTALTCQIEITQQCLIKGLHQANWWGVPDIFTSLGCSHELMVNQGVKLQGNKKRRRVDDMVSHEEVMFRHLTKKASGGQI